jgi:hypothetical protein
MAGLISTNAQGATVAQKEGRNEMLVTLGGAIGEDGIRRKSASGAKRTAPGETPRGGKTNMVTQTEDVLVDTPLAAGG